MLAVPTGTMCACAVMHYVPYLLPYFLHAVQIRYTPLHAAAAAGQVGSILLMVEAGAFVAPEVRGHCCVAQGKWFTSDMSSL